MDEIIYRVTDKYLLALAAKDLKNKLGMVPRELEVTTCLEMGMQKNGMLSTGLCIVTQFCIDRILLLR